MNEYSEAVLFAVVLAVNLFLLGAVLAGGCTLAFKFVGNAAPRLRYLIAVAVFLLTVLLPFTVTLKIGQKPPPGTIIEKTISTDDGGDFAGQPDVPIKQDIVASLTKVPSDRTDGILDNFIAAVAGSAFGTVFPGLWIAGIFVLVLREIPGVRRMRKARKSWRLATEAEKRLLLGESRTRLYFAEDQSPGTIGWLRPMIVLPEKFFRTFSLDAGRLIVRHELSHARWRDPLGSFLLRIIRAVFWISPAIWMLERLIDSEREAAADRAAMLLPGEGTELRTVSLNYAETLLLAAKEFGSFKALHQNRNFPSIGIAGADANDLEIRIRRLLSSARTTRLHIASATVAVLLTSTAAVVMPLAAFSDKLRIQQIRAEASNRLDQRPDQEKLSHIIPSDQTEKFSQKLNSDDQKSFDQSISVITTSSKTENIRKTSSREITDSAVTRQTSQALQDYSAENFNDAAVLTGYSRLSAETLSDEDARRSDDQSKRNSPPPARPLGEAEAVTITGDRHVEPARASELKENLSELGKLRTNLTSEDVLVRQKAASELDRLSSSGNMPEPAREFNRTPSRTRNLTAPASRIQ